MVVLKQAATFQPLGSMESEILPAGEFTICDSQHALCRLNSKQSRLSSTSLSTKSLLIYAQGNKLLEGQQLKKAIDVACESIIRFTGGHREPMVQVEAPQN
jgi:DNA/RNA-binding domain of Phe-tRNA-synthetase-like protein